jgi:transposase
MIWGAIGWDYKSPLVFLEKLPGRKGVCSKAYLQQVLEPVAVLLFGSLGPEYIFMEDGLKVHLGKARLLRLEHGIRGFNWPPFSPDLNPIERVWRYMKEKLKQLPYVITTKAELKAEIQKIWDGIDPRDFRYYTERLTCIIEDVIKNKRWRNY